MNTLVLVLLGVTALEAAAMKREEEVNLGPVYFAALDGNVKAALEKLHSINLGVLSPKEIDTRKKYLERFGGPELPSHPKGSSLAEELAGIYRGYWDRVLLQKLDQIEGYRYLFNELMPIVNRIGEMSAGFSEEKYRLLAALLESQLKKEGYFSWIGNVSPHLNLMIWKKETLVPYLVDLGDGTVEEVHVVLMEDFVSLGWAAYATFDRHHVGGWVGDDLIYCVAASYDFESEEFRVSFLGHEARHVADKKKYPKLKPLDLEYRAKLNELILADDFLLTLLRKFLLEGRENPSNPHSYASFLMLQQLSKRLKKPISLDGLPFISKDWLREEARRLLRKHSEALNRHRPQEVESVLGLD